MGLHWLLTLATQRDMVGPISNFAKFRTWIKFFRMFLFFVTAVHIERVAVNFIHVGSKSARYISQILFKCIVCCIHQCIRFFYFLTVEIINILRNKHCLNAFTSCTVLLKLSNQLVTEIWFAFRLKFIKIIMPFPHCCGILPEEVVSKDLFWIFTTAVCLSLFPESILSSKGGYTACCTDSSACQYHY